MRDIKFRAWDKRFKQMDYKPLVSTYEAGVNDEFYYAESGQSGLIFLQYTGLKDKNGKEIYEGDIVEFYDWCYCTDGTYSEGECKGRASEIDDGFIKRAKDAGYTAEERWTPYDDTEWVLFHKPMRGVVKYNEEVGAYEPLIRSQEDYNNSCFYYVINNMRGDKKGTEAYCEVIGNIYENPELI